MLSKKRSSNKSKSSNNQKLAEKSKNYLLILGCLDKEKPNNNTNSDQGVAIRRSKRTLKSSTKLNPFEYEIFPSKSTALPKLTKARYPYQSPYDPEPEIRKFKFYKYILIAYTLSKSKKQTTKPQPPPKKTAAISLNDIKEELKENEPSEQRFDYESKNHTSPLFIINQILIEFQYLYHYFVCIPNIFPFYRGWEQYHRE